ncbi:ATP-binding protein [Patescibacteria group bacterium]|nr:ATP-binding protein [Patescibacteria group bacterium]MBU1895735.1 ATP-binding protein [Patescibacteria group bacterium]
MKAVCFRGPAGVGKTTLAYEVGRDIVKKTLMSNKLGYISADMFAHISFDCRYTDNEIDFKYDLIHQIVGRLAKQGYTVIYDDTFQRYKDYVAMIDCLSSNGYNVHLFSLTAPLEVVLSRNKARFWKERISNARVKMLHAIHTEHSRADETAINTLLTVEHNSSLILKEVYGVNLTL